MQDGAKNGETRGAVSERLRSLETKYERQRRHLAGGSQQILVTAAGGLGGLVIGISLFRAFGATLLSWAEFLTVAGCLAGAALIYAAGLLGEVAWLKLKVERAKEEVRHARGDMPALPSVAIADSDAR
jgi:hypothetical protein